ncbi:MAG: ester cyclase [Candidatus Dadabacteria bacterium]|nr:ester cyclase [Candidatus Dadabacteria bacterium]
MQKDQVRKFYNVIWDEYDKDAIPSVLSTDLTFRGSLGQEKRGHQGFIEYLDFVHEALGGYASIIEELVEEGNKVFAKMTFTGVHQNDFMGYPPTDKRVSWKGCALFTFNGDLVADVWVLGDLKSLEEELKRNELNK